MLTGYVDHFSRHEIYGWAADTATPEAVIDVTVHINGRMIGTIPAGLRRDDLAQTGSLGDGRHGFRCKINPPMPASMTHAIKVSFKANGQALPNGHRRMFAERLTAGRTSLAPAEPLRPVLVTSIGRSGSTLLMNRLRQQPELVVPEPIPYEVRIAGYYASTYRVLTEMDDGAMRANVNGLAAACQVGAMPFEDQVQRFPHLFRHEIPYVMGTILRDVIAAFYARTAAADGRPHARFFAEKAEFAGDTRAILRGLFPELREIVLVRDLRDLYCSSRAFWGLDEAAGLARLVQARDEQLALRTAPPDGVMLLRYEDLVSAPERAQERLCRFLDLSPAALDPAAESALFAIHATSTAASASIGRWRAEILPDSVQALMAASGAFHSAFDYQA